jgi:hypothetical protein
MYYLDANGEKQDRELWEELLGETFPDRATTPATSQEKAAKPKGLSS